MVTVQRPGTARPATPGRARSRPGWFTLPRRARRALVVLHVAVSVAWLGVSLGLLTFSLTARLTDDAGTVAVAYRAMSILAETILVPIALTALVSGVVLAAARPWGLTHHYWILVKLVLTTVTAGLTVFSLRPAISGAVDALATGGPGPELVNSLTAAPIVSTVTYASLVAVSVLKPWGRVRRVRRR
ncbi:DUF2269 family protein [Sphaerisporangium sp. TRM90804]|uniref:DUF2269 family protein n=1 Tax=Sphaerisporangium sp. TRM90804 TaxID=3031113 RepID=UPI00244C21E6|nr:DUF2269 family protein [Sphaerisporangium sp. TRM90804]MDH2426581.1 DUF2269 family protein [Sphaerisporangium sp. TRM90804]